MRISSTLSAGRPHEEWMHTFSMIRRAVSMETVTEDGKRSNTAAELKSLNTVKGEQ